VWRATTEAQFYTGKVYVAGTLMSREIWVNVEVFWATGKLCE